MSIQNYDDFAKTFAKSRKNLKWEEIDYLLDTYIVWKSGEILDLWCWSWRLLSNIKSKNIDFNRYVWIDNSKILLEQVNNEWKNIRFLLWDMTEFDYKKIWKFDYIFLLASFHHIDDIKKRSQLIINLKQILNKNWKILMTNWALNSDLNSDKYSDSIIGNSINKYWSMDYNIKIWKYNRFYHCFDLSELEEIMKSSWINIIENRLFDNHKNIITISWQNT